MTRTWHPQPLPITVQLSPVGRWMPATESVDRSPSEVDTFVRDEGPTTRTGRHAAGCVDVPQHM